MARCSQCGTPAVYELEGHPLCVRCMDTIQQIHNTKLNQLNAMANYYSDLMAETVGLPRMGPYIETPQPTTVIQQGPTNLNTINNIRVESGSQVGQISAGAIVSVDHAVTVFAQKGNEELAKHLSEFTQAVLDSKELNLETQRKILDSLQFIISEVAKQKGQRNPSVVATVLDSLKSLVGSVERIGLLYEKLRPLLDGLF